MRNTYSYKEVCSFIEVRKSSLIMFPLLYVCDYTTICDHHPHHHHVVLQARILLTLSLSLPLSLSLTLSLSLSLSNTHTIHTCGLLPLAGFLVSIQCPHNLMNKSLCWTANIVTSIRAILLENFFL